MREAIVGDHPCAELLGPGDLLRAWEDRDAEVLLPRTVEWSALSTVRLAVIDQALAVRAAQWPEIFASLVERAARRAERLVVMQAIAHLTRVDDRLLALLWCLAERWGRVSPNGVVVSLRLPHRTLAGMVGARRPSVTTALGQLIARGEVERRPDGGWLLLGEPPEPRQRPVEDHRSIAFERHIGLSVVDPGERRWPPVPGKGRTACRSRRHCPLGPGRRGALCSQAERGVSAPAAARSSCANGTGTEP